MSNEAQGLVRNLDLSAPNKPILMAYANYADEAGYCWPGVDTIAFDTGFSVETVVKTRRLLVKQGWLRTKRRFGTSAITRINLAKASAEGIDRGDRTKLKPEFEFEDETAGHTQRSLSDLNGKPTGSSKKSVRPVDQVSQTCRSGLTDHLHISDSSEDPSSRPSADAAGDGDAVSDEKNNDTSGHEPASGEHDDAAGDKGESQESAAGDAQERARALLTSLRMPKGAPFNPHRKAIGHVAAALEAGLTEDVITQHLMADTAEAQKPAALVSTNAGSLPSVITQRDTQSGSQGQQSAMPEWCGECGPNRQLTNDDGSVARCPRCNPRSSRFQVAGDAA